MKRLKIDDADMDSVWRHCTGRHVERLTRLSAPMGWLLMASCLTVTAAYPPEHAFGQDKNANRQDRARRQAEIDKRGSLPISRAEYERLKIARFGPKRTMPASQTMAARVLKPGQPQPKSTVHLIGEAPDGFGGFATWDPGDAGLAAIIYLNAADDMGVLISGAKPTDTIEVVSATGIASFSEDTENEGVASLIGIVAAGANVTASSFGAPELVPVISAAAEFAKSRFQEKKVKTYRRDAYGEDPGTGLKARAEGGVIVMLPGSKRLFYSGNRDYQDRWIKQPGTRDDAHRPDHVKGAFFLRADGPDKRVAREAGDFIIGPWDHKFEDNFGFYRLHVLLKRGSGTFPEPQVD